MSVTVASPGSYASDGCSALAALPYPVRLRLQWQVLRLVGRDRATARLADQACREHDLAYCLGGSRRDRLEADRRLRRAWRAAGMPRWWCEVGYRAVRWWGGPRRRLGGVSWAFCHGRFVYGEPLGPGARYPRRAPSSPAPHASGNARDRRRARRAQ